MKPELSPGCLTKKDGNLLSWLLTKRSTRRSDTFPISERAIPKKSNGCAIGSPWKLPPEMTCPSLVMIGLSVTELI